MSLPGAWAELTIAAAGAHNVLLIGPSDRFAKIGLFVATRDRIQRFGVLPPPVRRG